MSQGVGELNVGVTARTSKARKNINEFRRDVRGIRGDSQVASHGVAALGAKLGVLGGIAAAAMYGIRAGIEGIDQVDGLVKTADKLGIATERLAGLRFAAKESGVEVRTLDTGLQRMVRRVSEAAQGTGEAQSALLELGLNAEQLNLEAPDEQLRSIAEAMGRLPSQSEKVRIAFKLFDSEGVALVNTLKEGRKGLDDAQEAAERLGIAIDRQTAIKAEKAREEFDRLSVAADGLKREFGLTIAPSLGHGARFLQDMMRAARTLGGVLSDEATEAEKAAFAAREKAAADERAAAAAANRKRKEADLTQEYEKQLKTIKHRGLGEDVAQFRKDVEKFGLPRATNLQGERERVAEAKERADQEKRLLDLKRQIADLDKTQLQREREAELRKTFGRDKKAEVNALYDQLEQAQLAQKKAEEDAREKQRRESELAQERKREREQLKREAEQNRKTVFEDRLRRANRGNAEILNARTSEGYAALRSSMHQTDRQTLMLKIAQEQKSEQTRAADLLEDIAENQAEKIKVFAFN